MFDRRQLLTGAALAATGLITARGRTGAATTGHWPSGAVPFLGLPVIPRSRWAAGEQLRAPEPLEFSPAQLLTVHHSALAVGADPAAAVREAYHLHVDTNGWDDIGYQLLIGPEGTVFAGRSTGDDASPVFEAGRRPTTSVRPPMARVVTGAHARGYNQGNIGICLLGDFTRRQPPAPQRAALVELLAALCTRLRLDPLGTLEYHSPSSGERRQARSISMHRDWNDTECPGNAFAPMLGGVRRRVAAVMAQHGHR